MNDFYILDACAIIAFFSDEHGADEVESLLCRAERGGASLFMHNINVLEVYYGVRRVYGEPFAARGLENIHRLPITFLSEIGGVSFIEAGRLKSSYKMSLGDAVLLGEASTQNAFVVTSDHHELDAVEAAEPIKFFWIR
jgi:PIN domain nuclease of toxin-antitoxin system